MPEGSEQQDQNDRVRKEYARRVQAAQLEQQKREIARRLMTTEAYERLMNVRIANPEVYHQLIGVIVQMAQQNRIAGKLTEEQLKSILAKLTFKPEPTIAFKHK